jgi:hypothetical protein
VESDCLKWYPQKLSGSGTRDLTLLTQEVEGDHTVVKVDLNGGKELSDP